ncbi:MAG: Phosphoheptose isomerase 1 [Alphaproteobacteria bacterium MarineAlpha2_Bin1]|nr:MAG: Phosphoheptose isomerase 1 [Alphaproteobacteria bacterium MarineAlpha2_Bin1]
MKNLINKYFERISDLSTLATVKCNKNKIYDLSETIDLFIKKSYKSTRSGKKLMFIGNGGSSTIASHMAEDFSKAANLRSLAFNDPAFITCLGNDYGYEHIFSKQIELFAQEGDILVAISSSGESMNIINAVKVAKELGCWILTLSGFKKNNQLNKLGNRNIYIPSDQYGFVEIAHLTICHGALDIALGWNDKTININQLKVAI